MNLLDLLRSFGADADLIALVERWVGRTTEGAEALTDDELTSLYDSLTALANDDEAGVGLLIAAADVVDEIRTEQNARAEAEAEAEAARNEAINRLRGEASDDDEGDDDEPTVTEPGADDDVPDGSEPAPSETETPGVVDPADRPVVGADEAEPVTADARSQRAPLHAIARRQPPAHQPPEPDRERAMLQFAADVPGVSAGQRVAADRRGLMQLSEAMQRRYESFRRSRGGVVDGEDFIVVGTLSGVIPEDRRLTDGDGALLAPLQMARIVERVMAREGIAEAITAAGGLCAPLMPYYGVETLGDTGRPVADEAMVTFGAARGGIVSFAPPVLPNTAYGVDIWTMDDDEQAASDPNKVKTIATVTCGTPRESKIRAITARLQFGEIISRTFGEWTQAWSDLQAVQYARVAEQTLLADIKAGSTKPNTLTTKVSATRDVLNFLNRAAWGMRSRHRELRTFPFRVILPEIFLAVMAEDIANAMPGVSIDDNLAVALTRINAWFTSRNLNVTWSPDMSVIGAQAPTTVLAELPPTIEAAIYPEGTWLRLDAGEIDYGVVRDVSTIQQNNFQTFAEGFEAGHKLGAESLWLTMNVCPSGASNGTLDPAGMCASYT